MNIFQILNETAGLFLCKMTCLIYRILKYEKLFVCLEQGTNDNFLVIAFPYIDMINYTGNVNTLTESLFYFPNGTVLWVVLSS